MELHMLAKHPGRDLDRELICHRGLFREGSDCIENSASLCNHHSSSQHILRLTAQQIVELTVCSWTDESIRKKKEEDKKISTYELSSLSKLSLSPSYYLRLQIWNYGKNFSRLRNGFVNILTRKVDCRKLVFFCFEWKVPVIFWKF